MRERLQQREPYRGKASPSHAPQFLDLEVTQVLRRLVQRKEISIGRSERALDDFANLVVERHDHRPLVSRTSQLRDLLSAYDAAYVALAEALDSPLITCDEELAGARGHRVTIELMANWVGPETAQHQMSRSNLL